MDSHSVGAGSASSVEEEVPSRLVLPRVVVAVTLFSRRRVMGCCSPHALVVCARPDGFVLDELGLEDGGGGFADGTLDAYDRQVRCMVYYARLAAT